MTGRERKGGREGGEGEEGREGGREGREREGGRKRVISLLQSLTFC